MAEDITDFFEYEEEVIQKEVEKLSSEKTPEQLEVEKDLEVTNQVYKEFVAGEYEDVGIIESELVYPHIELQGLTENHQLKAMLLLITKVDEDSEVPVYVEIEDKLMEIAQIEISYRNLYNITQVMGVRALTVAGPEEEPMEITMEVLRELILL